MGWRDHLREQFGDRVTFDPVERARYRWDAGYRRVDDARACEAPWAVVEPERVEELVCLAHLARKYHLPLVPRGAGTGCHGGSVPSHGGIVVLFRRMNRIIEVDTDRLTVRVEPGLVIQELARQISPHHLNLRIYPTSAAEATIGGWVAEGGAGIGSYEFGPVGHNLASVTLVTPQGEMHELSEDDLDLVRGAQGITGFIADLTLKVSRMEAQVPVVAEFDSLIGLAEAIQEVGRRELEIWHVGFVTDHQRLPGGAAPAPRSPRRRHLAYFVYPFRRRALGPALEAAALRWNGRLLAKQEAEQEWAGRFQLMSLRKQAPFLEPSQAYVPMDRLARFLEQIEIRRPDYVTQGILADRHKAAVLSCRPTSEEPRSRIDDPAVAEIAAASGGSAYSPALRFSGNGTPSAPGDRLRRFKRHQDPHHLFNPGKILPDRVKTGPLGQLIGGNPIKRLIGGNPIERLRQWVTGR